MFVVLESCGLGVIVVGVVLESCGLDVIVVGVVLVKKFIDLGGFSD